MEKSMFENEKRKRDGRRERREERREQRRAVRDREREVEAKIVDIIKRKFLILFQYSGLIIITF